MGQGGGEVIRAIAVFALWWLVLLSAYLFILSYDPVWVWTLLA